jgi:hypothetical protein
MLMAWVQNDREQVVLDLEKTSLFAQNFLRIFCGLRNWIAEI